MWALLFDLSATYLDLPVSTGNKNCWIVLGSTYMSGFKGRAMLFCSSELTSVGTGMTPAGTFLFTSGKFSASIS